GMITFASGIGALVLKFAAQPILRRFGFRRVLMVNTLISSVFILAPASFTPQTPWLLMLGVLFVGGLSRSLQFTSVNAIAYAEVPSERLSSATSFTAVLQQLSGSIGITLAAMTLEGAGWMRGTSATDLGNFPIVFIVIALLSLSSAVILAKLSPQAGSQLVRATD
ncbi:MAG: MFS transporter, partial [Cypionkella sp.]|nr:MFS transporter [Cypionkella sp.]